MSNLFGFGRYLRSEFWHIFVTENNRDIYETESSAGLIDLEVNQLGWERLIRKTFMEASSRRYLAL